MRLGLCIRCGMGSGVRRGGAPGGIPGAHLARLLRAHPGPCLVKKDSGGGLAKVQKKDSLVKVSDPNSLKCYATDCGSPKIIMKFSLCYANFAQN